MLNQQQLAHRQWLRETEEELKTLKIKLGGDTNAVISSLIKCSASKLLAK